MDNYNLISEGLDLYKPTPEELDQHFNALGDSVTVINELKDNGPRDHQSAEEAADEIKRNVEHIKSMLERDYIKDAGRDLSDYEAAVAKGS